MADARRLLGEARGELRVARRDDRPAVDEYLRADLLRDGSPIGRDRTAHRRRDPAFEIEPRRMFRRVAVAAPPENGALLDDVVEPRLPDFPRREVRARAMVLERANEGERSGDVVVGHDQRTIEAIVNVIFDRSELSDDALIGPVLERPAKVHADQLAEHGGISAVEIVGWQLSHRTSPRDGRQTETLPGASHHRPVHHCERSEAIQLSTRDYLDALAAPAV